MREISKKKKRKECKVCHRKFYWISENGLCEKCMKEKILNARSQIKVKEGPVYLKWRDNQIKALERGKNALEK